MGEVQLSLVEGGAGEMSCVVTDDPRDWGVKIDTVAGAVTAVDRWGCKGVRVCSWQGEGVRVCERE